jgi:hypothetical protein
VQRRGNKRAGPAAIIIFIMIVALVITICWLFAQGLQKDLNGLPRGSQTLPAQAAQGTVTASPPETGPAQ